MSKLYIEQANHQFNKVRLSPSKGTPIQAFIESDVAVSMGAEWSPLFGSVESKVTSAETTANLISTAVGQGAFSLRNQTLSIVRWQRTQPLQIPLNLTFVATSKGTYKKEVTEPMDTLLAGVFPSPDLGGKSTVTQGTTLKPPMDYDGQGENGLWKIAIGNSFRSSFYFVLKEVSPVISKFQTEEGALYIKVQVLFETYRVPTYEEVSGWFDPTTDRATIKGS